MACFKLLTYHLAGGIEENNIRHVRMASDSAEIQNKSSTFKSSVITWASLLVESTII
jgi:hypothetical protein